MLACLVFFAATVPVEAWAQSRRYRPPARYVQIGEPDQAEGRKIMVEFRKLSLAGDSYLEFELHVLPRRAEGRKVPGARLWASRNEQGPISRVEIPGVNGGAPQRLLVQNGPAGAVWTTAKTGAVSADPVVLDPGALFVPLAETNITAFDLQMPFLYWNDFVFEGVAPVRGRPAHVFLMYPPDEIAARKPDLFGVRVYLDTQFGALVQAQQIGADDKPIKSITILDLKKVDDQYLPKLIDVRDDLTRDKTQFVVTGAALGLDFSAALFDPAFLAEPVTPPPASRVRRVGP